MVDQLHPIRQDTRSITVTVYYPGSDTPIIKGIWDKRSGGQVDSEETLYHPGDMADPISLGGRRNVENVTLQRLCRVQRDWQALPVLMASVGKSRVTVSDQPLDFDGHVIGNPVVWNGTLKRVTPPDADSESSGAALVEIEVTPDGYPA